MQNRHNMQFNTLNTHTVNIKIINKIELIFQTIECNTFTLNTHTVDGYGLEIPVIYRFYGKEKTIMWLTKKLKAINDELQCKISKC